MKLNKEQFNKWIEALDSGKYKQGIGALQDENKYCCLGVACRILIPNEKLMFKYGNSMAGGMPAQQEAAPQWLKDISTNFKRKTGKEISEMNDDLKLKFPEIATMLELVYVHKALD
jgi:hypothetical protein